MQWPAQVAADEAGVDGSALAHLIERANESGSDAIVVLVDGRLVHEEYFGGERAPIELMSCTKAILSLLVGILVDDRAIPTLDTPLACWFPEFLDGGGGERDPELRAQRMRVTLRHLLTQTTGVLSDHLFDEITATRDAVETALRAKLTAPPGTLFQYDNVACNLLPAIIERAGGKPFQEFLRARLFGPLGIVDWGWTRDVAGHPLGMSGCQLHARDLARIGQLVLQRGEWDGRRLVSERWLDESLRPEFARLGGRAATYGRHWWIEERKTRPDAPRDEAIRSIRAEGFLGNYLVVVPRTKVVAVRQRRFPTRVADAADISRGLNDFDSLVRRLVRVKAGR